MKIKNQVALFVMLMILSISFVACGTARGANNKGGKNCDCPKFGETNTQQNVPTDELSS